VSASSRAIVARTPRWRWLRNWCNVVLLCAGGMFGLACAQVAQPGGKARQSSAEPRQRSVSEWLSRMQQASRVPSYVGTFVVSSSGGAMSSARIWHVRQGNVELERVETLTGSPRAIFRRNDEVVTFLPQSHTVKTEWSGAGGGMSNRFAVDALGLMTDFYTVRQIGQERVAGVTADIVQLSPRDSLRFGYRIWSEQRTGLAIKTETFDSAGHVLEQAAFSELRLDAPVKASTLQRMMGDTKGYKVEPSERVPSSAESEGWRMKNAMPGFRQQNCYRREVAMGEQVVHWIFSDGLATVSLFIEPFQAERHVREGVAVMGATHALTRRLTATDKHWWITAMGEVPASTLGAFIDNLERHP
jgi:sigma-E factor negative regulatory protein RseB